MFFLIFIKSLKIIRINSFQTYYSNSVANIPDTTIANLNSIVQGFSSTDCMQLRISSTNTISILGLLTGFSSDQVCFFKLFFQVFSMIKNGNIFIIATRLDYCHNIKHGLNRRNKNCFNGKFSMWFNLNSTKCNFEHWFYVISKHK